MFDKEMFFLVPESHILKAILEHVKSNKTHRASGDEVQPLGLPPLYPLEVVSVEPHCTHIMDLQCFTLKRDHWYHYTLVPVPGQMVDISVNYEKFITSDQELPSTHIISYRHPYNDLPRIESHVHPAFVITKASLTYTKSTHPILDVELMKNFTTSLGHHWSDIAMMDEIYQLWVGFELPIPYSSALYTDSTSSLEDPTTDRLKRSQGQSGSFHTEECRASVPSLAGRKRLRLDYKASDRR